MDTARLQKTEGQDNLARNETSIIHFGVILFGIFCLPWQNERQALQLSVMHPDWHWLHKEHTSAYEAESPGFKDLQPTHTRGETTATLKDHHTKVKMWAILLPMEESRYEQHCFPGKIQEFIFSELV